MYVYQQTKENAHVFSLLRSLKRCQYNSIQDHG